MDFIRRFFARFARPRQPVEPVPREEALAAWAAVLSAHVNTAGQFDFHGIRRNPESLRNLKRYLDYATQVRSDLQLQSDAQRLAHFINTYNALALYRMVLMPRLPQKLSYLRIVVFFFLRFFRIDGRVQSLMQYEYMLTDKDPRAHFAVNCMATSCPRMRREPYGEEGLDQQLTDRGRLFFSEPRNCRIDRERRIIHLSMVVRFYRRQFLRDGQTVIQFVNQYLDEPVDEDFKVKWLSYDWTVNVDTSAAALPPPSAPLALSRASREIPGA